MIDAATAKLSWRPDSSGHGTIGAVGAGPVRPSGLAARTHSHAAASRKRTARGRTEQSGLGGEEIIPARGRFGKPHRPAGGDPGAQERRLRGVESRHDGDETNG